MTEQEKMFLHNSAILCKNWNSLRNEIITKQSQIQDTKKLENQYNIDSQKYANKHEKNLKNTILAFFRCLFMYIVIPFLPIALYILNICSKNRIKSYEKLSDFVQSNLGTQYIPTLKFLLGLAIFLAFCGFILNIVLSKTFAKRKHNHYLAEFSKNNSAVFNQKINDINKRNNELSIEISNLESRISDLEKTMLQKSNCCIHKDYWYAGEQLDYLVECGRADSLKEAINLFEKIKEDERRKIAEAEAIEAQRWEKISEMMDESEKLDRLERTIKKAIDDVL